MFNQNSVTNWRIRIIRKNTLCTKHFNDKPNSFFIRHKNIPIISTRKRIIENINKILNKGITIGTKYSLLPIAHICYISKYAI